MKRLILTFVLSFLFFQTAYAQTFTVNGSSLRDANGNNFVIRGMNIPLIWFNNDVYNNIGAMKSVTNANTVRIVWSIEGSDAVLQNAIRRTIENNMIPMVELHTATGSNDPNRLAQMAQWWADRASYFRQADVERYILINIANEWSDWYMANPGGPEVTVWRDAYKRAITIIRNSGIRSTLVIDGAAYGQDLQSSLLAFGRELINHDPRNNLLYSVHMYCDWTSVSKIESQLQAMKNANLPIIIGEFGNNHPPCGNLPYRDLMRISQEKGIGYLAWSWKGNTTGTLDQLDMSRNWNGTSLTPWGNDVVNGANGIRATSRDASVFGGSSGSYPTCSSAASDPDGDGWGWENNQSCQVSNSSGFPTCSSAASDPDGDGWGWENNQSCQVNSASGSTTCNWYGSIFPICTNTSSGWGWENDRSCVSRSTCSSQ